MTPLAHGIGHGVSLASSGAVKPANPFPLLFYVPFDEVGSSPTPFSADAVSGLLPNTQTGTAGYATGGVIDGHLLNTGDTCLISWYQSRMDSLCLDYASFPWTIECFGYIRSLTSHTLEMFGLLENQFNIATNAIDIYAFYNGSKAIEIDVFKNNSMVISQVFSYVFDATWNHFAVSSDGVNLYVCANGKIIGVILGGASLMPTIRSNQVNRQFRVYCNDWHIKLDNLAISSGCRYSGNVGDDYVLPTAKYAV